MRLSNDEPMLVTLDELQRCLNAQLALDEPDLAQLASLDAQVRTLVTAAMAEPALEGCMADRLASLLQSYAQLIAAVEGVRQRTAETLREAGRTGRAAQAYQSLARGPSRSG